ncbi:aminoglycoside phosphotransferase family protein [Alkalihalobacterium elongatum]|uniref:aminoglycoside phosphotransferase family protein n=1 Tax=Alkalihalobacterium elongatum TaxID=2675466 RepID=UPI001C200518|nr:aminoglycoside phosphotransferase family protein [Alkalihalobacterium elongatum]
MELQLQFVQNVKHCFNELGKKWLDELPNIIKYCEEKWSLQIQKPYTLSINYAAPAKLLNGKEVVVKLCLPGDEFLGELEALQLLQKRGIVRLIDADTERGVMVLEKITPGHALADMNEDEDACLIAARVFRTLITRVPTITKISTTKDREKKLREIFSEHRNGIGPITKDTLEKALKLFHYLNKTTKESWLLHGDFHPYNILLCKDGSWKAIDPKGLIGEAEYDLIQYLLNKLPEEGAYDVMRKRVDIFTHELQLDKKRLLLWGYCHAVLATSWTVDGDNYSRSFYQGIMIFEKLYEESFGIKK